MAVATRIAVTVAATGSVSSYCVATAKTFPTKEEEANQKKTTTTKTMMIAK